MPGFLVTLLIGSTRSAVLILLLLGSFSASAAAEENRWGFGTDVGVWTGTTNDSVFALGLHLDYYMDRNFSFGGMAPDETRANFDLFAAEVLPELQRHDVGGDIGVTYDARPADTLALD